jgi:hypothetical protein
MTEVTMASRSRLSPGASLVTEVRVLSRASKTQVGVESQKAIAILCGLGLLVSLAFASSGLDMSAGFF